MTQAYGIEFFEYEGDLGLCQASIVEVDGTVFWLSAYPDGAQDARFVTASVRSFEPDSEIALHRLIGALGVERSALRWRQNDLGPAAWVLVRLNDNGNEFEMNRFLRRECAEHVRDGDTEKGHKQTYTVREAT